MNVQQLVLTVCLVVTFGLTSCATTPDESDSEPAKRTIEEVMEPGEELATTVYDPWEGYNRWMYNFNAKFDRYLFLPVVSGYKTVLPQFARDGIFNVFRNLGEFRNIANSLLQAKPVQSGRSLGRFVVNSTIGVGGLFDPATSFGLYFQREDFGQTLGVWGVGPGPYLVLPLLGPNTLRDSTSFLVDAAIHPIYEPYPWLFELKTEELYAVAVLEGVEVRSRLGFKYYEMGSPYEYILVRKLWLEYRQLQIEK